MKLAYAMYSLLLLLENRFAIFQRVLAAEMKEENIDEIALLRMNNEETKSVWELDILGGQISSSFL